MTTNVDPKADQGDRRPVTTGPKVAPVCGPGEDFTDLVTVAEIGIVARQLGVNPIAEIESSGPQAFTAMARLGWVLDRRRNPQAQHVLWDALTLPELMAALAVPMGETREDTTARKELEAQTDEANPTGGAPA